MKRYFKQYFGFFDIQVLIVLFVSGLSYDSFWYRHGMLYIAFLSGIVLYSASEYFTHRYVFHMKPPRNKVLLQLMKRLHYDHHRDPSNLHLLFLPIWYSLPILIGLMVVVLVFTHSFHVASAMATGIIGALLYYEWTHFVAHRPIVPRTPWGKWMKKIHLWHHFKNENYWFGVTSPVYDLMMHTFPNEQSVERSTSARNIEM